MFGLDNNVLMGLVGVVLVFCLMTNKKSFKSLMKGNTLVIIGLTLLLLVCCMNKGGRVVEGFVAFYPEKCPIPNISDAFGWYGEHVGAGKLFEHNGADVTLNANYSEFCNLESSVITNIQCLVDFLSSNEMGGFANSEVIISKLDGIKERCENDIVLANKATAASVPLNDGLKGGQ